MTSKSIQARDRVIEHCHERWEHGRTCHGCRYNRGNDKCSRSQEDVIVAFVMRYYYRFRIRNETNQEAKNESDKNRSSRSHI